MKNIFVFLTISVFLFSCSDKGTVVIKGKLGNPSGKYIYLQELTVQGNGATDSVLLPKSGTFKFKKELKYPSFYSLRTGSDSRYITLLAEPGDRIKIRAQADSLFYTYQVTGSEESLYVKVLSQQLDKTIRCIDSLNNVYNQFKGNPNIVNIYNVLRMSYENCVKQQRDLTIAFIEKNTSALASIYAVYQKLNEKTWLLDQEGDFKYMVKVDSALYRKYSEVPYVKQLHANVDLMRQQNNALQVQKMLSVMGAKAPEIALPSASGDTARLSSVMKGKITLVYFWGSFNKESRDEQKKILPIYRMYKAKGFEIFGVSLDKNKTDWLNAVRTDGVWWIQTNDPKFWMSPVVKDYNFERLPSTFLLDKDGTIISRDLKGDALKNKLAELFGETSKDTAGR